MSVRLPARDLVRAAVTAAGALVLVWSMARTAGLLAAAAGAIVGSLAGAVLGRTRLRTGPAVALALTVAAVGQLLAAALVSSGLLAGLLGPLAARAGGDALLWGSIMAAGAFVLRLCAVRLAWMAAVEVGVLAAALASMLAPHRGGMVHRPLTLADWATSRGLDPQVVLLVLGAAASLGLAILLLGAGVAVRSALADRGRPPLDPDGESPRGRRLFHLATLAVITACVLLYIGKRGLPEPKAAADLGLTGKPRDEASPRPGPSGAPRGSGDMEPWETGEQGRAGPDREQRPEGEDPSGAGGAPRQSEDTELPFREEYGTSGGDAPVAVVLLGDDYSPPSGVYYFRQTVFSQYNGIRLVEASRDDVDRDVLDRFPGARVDLAAAPPVSAERAELPTTVGLIADHLRPFALDSLAALWPTENPDRLRFRRSYAAVSRVPTLPYRNMLGKRGGFDSWSAEQRAHYTAWPRQDPRYLELAQTILAQLPEKHRADPLARAIAVKMWLDQNGIYSRKNRHAGEDPVASFLFSDVTGYCVHFAHAAAFLLRALDVPTRVAGGYGVAEGRRGRGSAILIRGLDAHAWPEVAIEGVGWVVVDPSPERNLEQEGAEPDAALQRLLGEALRKGAGTPAARQATRWPSLRELGGMLLAMAVALAAYAAATKAWRALRPSFAPAAQMYRVAYRAAMDRLSEVGYRRRRGESREAFAARVAALSPAFVDLTAHHLGVALGSRRAAPPPSELRSLNDAVARDVRQHVPWWRRLLGLLNPFSFMLTR